MSDLLLDKSRLPCRRGPDDGIEVCRHRVMSLADSVWIITLEGLVIAAARAARLEASVTGAVRVLAVLLLAALLGGPKLS